MIKFDLDKVLLLQQLIIEASGGTAGVLDFKLLDSALNNCYQTFDGKELYPSKEEKGAILGYSLVSNHAFVDGNKRIGLVVMDSFLAFNGIKLSYTDEEMATIGLGIAAGSVSYNDLLEWIKSHEKY